MTAIQTTLIHLKSYLIDLGIVLSLSFFTKFWYALTNEMSVILIAHIFVLIVVSIIVRLIGRWIGEHIDELSDIDFMESFQCDEETFLLLKTPSVHGKIYKANKSYVVYDRNKIRIYSWFIVRTVETFELIDNGDTVVLKNISGKYDSSVTYEWTGTGILAHWYAKPKGLRRAVGLFFAGSAMKIMKRDFQAFIDNSKGGF